MEVTLAVLADHANVTQNGKLNMMGVFQNLNPLSIPYPHPRMFLVVSFEAGVAEVGAEKQLRVVLMESDGAELLQLEGTFVVPQPARLGEKAHVNQLLGLEGVTFNKSGEHAFHILVNEEEKKTVPLYVNEPPREGGEQ